MCSNDAQKPKGNGRKSTKGKQRPDYKRRVKPPYSYVELITMAIKSSPNQMKTLREILDYMQAKFLCFRGSYVGWKNSVRHNLSAAECFTKVLRNEQRPYGKDNYWTLNPSCAHCFSNATGRTGNQKRKASVSSSNKRVAAPKQLPGFIPFEQSSSATSISPPPSDSGFERNAVHEWVANQALSPRIVSVPSSNSDSQSTTQYIELRHTNRVKPSHQDISQLDFSSSVNRLSYGRPTYQVPSFERPKFNSSHCSRAPSSSSAAESLTTHSSEFESSSEAFDLETATDNLDMVMDDLFVPENDIDLSLYENWSGGRKTTSSLKMDQEVEQSYNASSPLSLSSASQPMSPFSTSSVSSEIRTSITPQPQPYCIKQELPPSPHQHQYPARPIPGGTIHHRPASVPNHQHRIQGPQFQSQYHSNNKQTSVPRHETECYNSLPPGVWMSCSSVPNNSSYRGCSRGSINNTSSNYCGFNNNSRSSMSNPVPNGSTPSLHSPKILPTFDSMVTSAVRDSLSLDFDYVTESLH